jgi:hypothetical protein
MNAKNAAAIACLVVGVPLAAWGWTHGVLLAGIGGTVLILVFWFLVWQWIAGANKPMGSETVIKPSANAAWGMKDQPAEPSQRADGKESERKP